MRHQDDSKECPTDEQRDITSALDWVEKSVDQCGHGCNLPDGPSSVIVVTLAARPSTREVCVPVERELSLPALVCVL